MQCKTVLLFYFLVECLGKKSQRWDSPRIIGGAPADITAFPFVVSLLFKPIGSPPKFVSAATIVSKKWALSAAHPVYFAFDLLHRYYLRGNSVRWNGGKGSVVHRLKKIYIHENFSKNALYDCDISLLNVKEPFGTGVEAPVAVASRKFKYTTRYYLDTAGWGFNVPNHQHIQKDLHAVALNLFDDSYCKRNFGKNYTHHMICGGWSWVGTKEVCLGDNGGPILQMGVLVGIISWGLGNCGRKDQPSVYTKVGALQGWIEEMEAKLGEKLE